jgi:Domain of unknown function (DUF4123)
VLSGKAIADLLRARLVAAPDEKVYGVVDGVPALDLALVARTTYNVEVRSLFRGPNAEVMAPVAPYFVPIDPFTGYLERWGEAWGRNAGVLFACPLEPDEVYEHAGRIFRLTTAEGPAFLRFYDPRVMQRVLPTFRRSALAAFFGPIRRFLMAGGEEGGEMVGASLSPAGALRWSNRSLDA